VVVRRIAGAWYGLVAEGILATFFGGVAQAATPLGSTQAQINANWPVALRNNLRTLHAHGGDAAVIKFFWQLSATQLYDLEHICPGIQPVHGWQESSALRNCSSTPDTGAL
jgi:hypothetical protein